MYSFLAIVIVIASILLTIVVLIQNSKGGGLAANFASGYQTFGVRQTADILEKLTWGFAITIIVLCIFITMFIAKDRSEASLVEQIQSETPMHSQPQFPQNPVKNTVDASEAMPAATETVPAQEQTPTNN